MPSAPQGRGVPRSPVAIASASLIDARALANRVGTGLDSPRAVGGEKGGEVRTRNTRRLLLGAALIVCGLFAALTLGACGSGTTRPLNPAEQQTLGAALGESTVRCALAAVSPGADAQDSKISGDLSALAAIYKKLGPNAKLGGGSKETLGQEVHRMIQDLSCAPSLAQVLIIATGGPANAAAANAQKQAQAEYQKCNSQIGALITIESNLNSHLDVGMNLHDYTSAVGDVRAAYDQAPIHQMDYQCLTAGSHAERAMNDYVSAANKWNTCLTDPNCSDASVKPQLQSEWSKAGGELDTAKSTLQGLQNPASVGNSSPPAPSAAATATPPPTDNSAPPAATGTTPNYVSADYCQQVGSKWVTNDAAESPCVPDLSKRNPALAVVPRKR